MDVGLDLPERVALYFREAHADGADCIDSCLTPDAKMSDEGRTIRGHDAIRAWKCETRARYRYTARPLSVTREGDALQVRARVAGDFPGSPVELDCAIMLADGRIAALRIR